MPLPYPLMWLWAPFTASRRLSIPPPALAWVLGVPTKQSISGSMLRLKPDGYSDDGATMGVSWTTRSEHLTVVVHRRAETGEAECEWSRSPYCCLPLSPFTAYARSLFEVPRGGAVAQRRRAHTPDSGDAQAGGVSPPFTVCAHSWFEAWGGRAAVAVSFAG